MELRQNQVADFNLQRLPFFPGSNRGLLGSEMAGCKVSDPRIEGASARDANQVARKVSDSAGAGAMRPSSATRALSTSFKARCHKTMASEFKQTAESKIFRAAGSTTSSSLYLSQYFHRAMAMHGSS